MGITNDSMIDLEDGDRLAKSLLDALGIPRKLVNSTISLTKHEYSLLTQCIESTDEHSIRQLLHNEETVPVIFNPRAWITDWVLGLMPEGSCKHSMLEMMLYVALDFQNHSSTTAIIDFCLEHEVRPATTILTRLLATACKKGSFAIVKYLLDTWTYTSEHCTTALEILIETLPSGDLSKDTCQTIELLLSAGADPNASHPPDRYSHGYILQRAVFAKSLNLIEILLSYGAKLSQSGALQAAVAINSIDALNLLLQHGADVNELLQERLRSTGRVQILSRGGESALNYAVRCASKESVKWLLEHGADPALFVETSLMRLDRDPKRMEMAEIIWDKLREKERKRDEPMVKSRRVGDGKRGTLFDTCDVVVSKPMARKAEIGVLVKKESLKDEDGGEKEVLRKRWPEKFKFEMARPVVLPGGVVDKKRKSDDHHTSGGDDGSRRVRNFRDFD